MEVLPALYRKGQLSWNPTVNKMTALALKSLMVIASCRFYPLHSLPLCLKGLRRRTIHRTV
jgi:hypothetical protein